MTADRKPLINSDLRWFMLAMVLANTAAQMAYSMLSLFMVDLGASVAQVGLVYTLASIAPMLLQLVGGWISDSIGRLRAIAIGSTISVFGYLLFFTSPTWQWVMIGLAVEYISAAFVGPSFSSYIAEQSDEASRGRVYGITRSIYMVVTVAGPALGGWLSGNFDFRLMLIISFVLYLLATLLRIWMALSRKFVKKDVIERPSFAGFKTQLVAMLGLMLSGGILTWIWISDSVSDISFTMIGELFPLYLSGVGKLTVEMIGFLGAAWGVASILGSAISGWYIDRRSERGILTLGFALVTSGLVFMMVTRSVAGFLGARVVSGLGVGLILPAFDSLISKVVAEEKRGLAFGFFGTSLGILSLPMPWIGGQLWERFTPQTPFWVTAAVSLLILPIAWFKLHAPRKEVDTVQK
jgi:MFS family permease